jgi:Transcriptional regulator, AbiEi antitoxin, Type IV TA system
MLKELPEVKIERDAVHRIKALLAEVPFLSVERVNRAVSDPNHRREADFLLEVKANGRSQRLVCEVKSNGQPRIVRAAIDQLRHFLPPRQRDTYGVVIAPYLSPAAQEICREENIGFLDFEGNCRLVFNGVFIERAVPLRPSTERRELKSIFAPKSAQVLRLLLRDPKGHWKVAELAERAGVSLGHASNVRTALIDREWARSDREGLVLTDPDALLDSWREVYTRPQGRQLPFYSTLHGSALQQRLPEILEEANRKGGAMLASFSAAQWLAPYARTSTNHFYANDKGLWVLRERLDLSSPARGENVLIMQIKEEGLFRDAVEPAPHLLCTSPVQTYLDLYVAGERGREAAEHLREEKLKWRSK